jgi:hypothetical protein
MTTVGSLHALETERKEKPVIAKSDEIARDAILVRKAPAMPRTGHERK